MKPCDPIDHLLNERIAAGDFPSAVYLVAEHGEKVFGNALGNACVVPHEVPAHFDTIYDLASLTKVLVTGLLVAKLAKDGKLSLEDTIAKHFPEFESTDKHSIKLIRLLSHTSGFKAWLPLYLLAGVDAPLAEREEAVFKLIVNEPLDNPPGTKVVYSDLNFILLGLLIEKIHEQDLDEVAKREIFEPLGLANTFFNPPNARVVDIAATETGNRHERKTCEELGHETGASDWREHVIRGEVHDGNCFYLNGVAGHAGLFSNANEVLRIASQFLSETTELLDTKTCELFRTNFTDGLNEARSVAFQLGATADSTASKSLSPDSFGHLGFTGTALWLEPETGRIFILLTNRTHDHELPFVNINSVRRTFNELAQKALESR